MNSNIKILFSILGGICMFSAVAVMAEDSVKNSFSEENTELRYPISRQNAQTLQERETPTPIDLRDPDNVKSEVEYDPATGQYVLRTQINGEDIKSPYVLDSEEYKQYSMQKSMQDYWQEKNSMQTHEGKDKGFNLTDMQFDIGKADEIFGPGGIQVKTSGSTELKFGLRKNKIDNPTLTERSRNPPPSFIFDEKIQLSVRGSVGDKINLEMNYNTEASFDFDQKMIKLAYQGKEDEILQKLEAGNVSMPLSGSLISGNSSLFGIRTQWKFGRLMVDAVVSQQQSDRQNVNMKNGSQMNNFDITVDNYDENRHFFLAQYFYESFNKSMRTYPVTSSVRINRVEVWITNKRGDYGQNRNVIALAELGENKLPTGSTYPDNMSNGIYQTVSPNKDADDINSVLSPYGISGEDYEKIDKARLLNSSEYTIHPQLGYISLKASLNTDEALAVAYEYTAGGKTYQVGEFSTNSAFANNNNHSYGSNFIADTVSVGRLVLKLLKGTDFSPDAPTWKLMMKNIYSLGAYQLMPEKFELKVMYQSDSTGVYLNYIPNSTISNRTLLSVMELDRFDNMNEPRPDGFFDFIEGYTVNSTTGRIIFPVTEPFGSHLKGKCPDCDKCVFQELYDLTMVEAQENSEKNKFKLVGRYKGSSGSEIRLNAMNVPRGSVSVTAGGRTLTENVDYTVDYAMGVVNIINTDVINSGQNVNVSLENKSFFNTQRKTLVGTHLDYQFNKDFNIGGTIMHLSEKPLTQKVSMGSEPISNTIWGLNTSYRTESQWLTNALDKIPLLKLTAPSSIAFTGEFAQLIPGHSKAINNYAYIDDFEAAKQTVDIRFPQNWKLASTPTGEFPEGKKSNDVSYGYNRALFSWYSIDPIFTRNNSSTPRHIRNDADQLSNHFVREIKEQEIFPNREIVYGQSSYLTILNLAYYPMERGPYNLDYNGILPNGKLKNPEKRWGGIMRKLESSSVDFEANNIEYIEFWLMDPFVYNNSADDNLRNQYQNNGGYLYLNLGNVSEDILKDGKMSFENGLPTDGDMSKVIETVWGRVPRVAALSNGFLPDNLEAQDVGLDGLSDDDEKLFGDYKEFRSQLEKILDAETLKAMQADPLSPLNDPAGDNYKHYRGSDHDEALRSVLDRYKHYNGTEGNSHTTNGTYNSAATSTPDTEDINSDNTLNDNEKYYQYKIELHPGMDVGTGFIIDKVTPKVTLPNGKRDSVTWYQFKIPITEYEDPAGKYDKPKNFKSIRFVRMFLTGFEEETHLRFGSLELVRGGWRKYTKSLNENNTNSAGTLDVSAVNIEENAAKEPIRYILPPGVSRVIDPGQPQIRQENEQAMVLKVKEVCNGDARAAYKKASMDMRQYKRLQMFVHAEKLLDDDGINQLQDYDLTVFLRLGSDHTNNFYEYEIPLKLTPHGSYNPNVSGDDWRVWPKDNMFDFALSKLTDAKLERNRTNFSLSAPYRLHDPDKQMNLITVVGNPSLSDVQVIMIGVRNKSNHCKSGEIWVNELRLSEFNKEGGYAALANVTVNLSDWGMVSVSGETRSSGFGGIEQNVLNKELEDSYQWNFATGMDLGRFFPEKAKIRIPFYYTLSQEVLTPKYNPLDQDVILQDALDNTNKRAEKDSIKVLSQTVVETKSISFSNVKVDIQSQKPKFYDPTNLSVGYTYTEQTMHDPQTESETTTTHAVRLAYIYRLSPKPLEPFSKLKPKQLRVIKEFGVNYLPAYISYTNDVTRSFYTYQTRDLTGTDNHLPPSFRQNFLWNRNFDMEYNITKNIKLTLLTTTHSRINEPYARDLYDRGIIDLDAAIWDSIKYNFRNGNGFTPLQYQQTFNADWNIPINKIPMLDWTNLRAQYSATYNWDRTVNPILDDGTKIELGNTAISNSNYQFDGRLNFETLYKKSAYLNKVNSRFASSTNTKKSDTKPQPKNHTEKISLKAGEKKIIRHRLNTTDIHLTASDSTGKAVPLKIKTIDKNSTEISSKTAVNNLSINISNETKENTPLDYILQGATRALMMVRNISGTYKVTNTLALPGFNSETGILGQEKFWQTSSAPGYDFVFGVFDKDDYIEKAQRRNWLINNDSIGNPMAINHTTDLQLRATVEPIRNLKIELNATRSTSEARMRQYYGGVPVETFTGTYSITQAAIGTALWKIGNKGNFDSEAFNNLMIYRSEIAGNLNYDPNSADVLIPAFLKAYAGKKPAKTASENIMPEWKKIGGVIPVPIPNWGITYNGLSNIEVIKKYLKNVNLTHRYRCIYNVGSYTSLLDWTHVEDGYGYYESRLLRDGNDEPVRIKSSQYDVGSVTITESFSPFFGIEVTTQNEITGKVEYKRSRTLNLNVASAQFIESTNNEWVFGAGYKLKNFDQILRIKQKQTKVSNDLVLRGDVSLKDIKSIIRKIDEVYSQPTSGSTGVTWRFTADYVFSEKVNIGAYLNRTSNTPFISSSYPTTSFEFGFLFRFILTR